MSKKPVLPLFVLCLGVIPYFAAGQQISGKVSDSESSAPLPGVNVVVKGTEKGTNTDIHGEFSIDAVVGDILVFSSLGFKTLEAAVEHTGRLSIYLEPDLQNLDQVVVVGYGTQQKSDVTGSITSLDPKRLEELPNTNFAQALQGAVPGLSVTLNNAGAEGNDNSIILRGRNSIKASNSPLIVLDGIPYNGSISDINPVDIASIDVLKDASAAAIYGSRGANGVLLITTKTGKAGKPMISYDGFYGIQEITNLPPTLSAEEFYNFKETREPGMMTISEQEIYDSGKATDWLDLATQQGARTQHTLSIRGGTEDLSYYVSATYLNVKGVAVNDNFDRLSTRVNMDLRITPWLSFATNTQLSLNDRSGLPAYFSGDFGAYMMNPLTSAYQEDGETLTIWPWPEDVFFANPLSPTLAKNEDRTYKVFTNNYLQVRFPFLEGLAYRLNTGVEHTSRENNTYWGRDTKAGLETLGDMSLSNSTNNNYIIENILSFDRSFGKHTVGFTGLYSYQYDNVKSHSLSAEGFPNDVLTWYQANIALLIEPSSNYAKEILISQMARINYSFDSKYLLTLTGRRDGFSGFGANKKFAFFPSVAVGWNLSNEPFFEAASKVVSNLKLRASYGSNGNQAVGAYQTLARLSERSYIDGTTTAPGYIPSKLGNPELGWETSVSFNAGLDFGLWNNRLQGTVDVYNSETTDLLLDRLISSVHGISEITQNIGRTSNKGVEIGLSSVNIQKNAFSWSTDANISFNRNKILELYGDGKDDILNRWFLGQPILVNYGLVFDGVWQEGDDFSKAPEGEDIQPGFAKVKDLNNDNKIDDQDRTLIGDREPDFIWGLGNTFQYKNFTLYVFMHGVQGVRRDNTLLSEGGVHAGVRRNTIAKNWWTPENPTNQYWANHIHANTHGVGIFQDASFVRIKDISLSYNLPAEVLNTLRISSMRIYLNTRNPFTFTKWTGLDPELGSQTAIPLQKEFLLGINVTL